MKELVRIKVAYDKIDRQLVGTGNLEATRVKAEQVLNDKAYFLLCWGQLELEIDRVCRDAIRSRRDDSSWQVRRSWYLYNPNDKRLSGLSFEDRAALVLDRSAGRGSACARTMTHYETRNQIAHGRLRATRVDVSAFVQDCALIQSALHRAA